MNGVQKQFRIRVRFTATRLADQRDLPIPAGPKAIATVYPEWLNKDPIHFHIDNLEYSVSRAEFFSHTEPL